MKLRTRITLWYALILLATVIVVSIANVVELREQAAQTPAEALEESNEGQFDAALEIMLYGVLPALLIGLVGGAIITRRALRPLSALAATLERTHVGNLGEEVSRSGNGDEVDRLAYVFNDLKRRLASSFEHARAFTLHASHELKTPLTIIHSSLEQLLAQSAAAPEVQERCGQLIEEVQRLSNTVGQLAYLARADAGDQSPTLARVQFDELVREAAEDAILLAAADNISVTLETCEPCAVTADRMRLRQLLVILVDNAVNHNRSSGQVVIVLRVDDTHEAQLSVRNTAPHNDMTDPNRVFQRFYRGDSAHGVQSEGSGLGLSIAEAIVRAHNGRIGFEKLTSGFVDVKVNLPLG